MTAVFTAVASVVLITVVAAFAAEMAVVAITVMHHAGQVFRYPADANAEEPMAAAEITAHIVASCHKIFRGIASPEYSMPMARGKCLHRQILLRCRAGKIPGQGSAKAAAFHAVAGGSAVDLRQLGITDFPLLFFFHGITPALVFRRGKESCKRDCQKL